MESARQFERVAVTNMQLNAYLSMQIFRTGDAQVMRLDVKMKPSDMERKRTRSWNCCSPSDVDDVVDQRRGTIVDQHLQRKRSLHEDGTPQILLITPSKKI